MYYVLEYSYAVVVIVDGDVDDTVVDDGVVLLHGSFESAMMMKF